MQNLEEAIRERAYHLWLADGRRDGHADAHWLNAQRDILAASLQAVTRVAVADAAVAVKAAPSKAPAKATTKAPAKPPAKRKRRVA